MGLVQKQVIWHLLNLCMVGVVLAFPRSSGFGEPLSLESYSPIPSIEPQAPRSRSEPGLILPPPTVSPPSSKLAPFHQNGKGPPPVPSYRDSATPPLARGLATSAPTQTPHDTSPPLSAEPPDDSVHPVAKPPRDSAPPLVVEVPVVPHYSTLPPIAGSAHAPSAMVLPVDTTSPPVAGLVHAPSAMVLPIGTTPPPVAVSAFVPSAMASPVEATPPPFAESAHAPSDMVMPVDTTPPPVAESAHAPSAMVPPVDETTPVVEPPHASDKPLPANPPKVLTPEPPVKAPPLLPTPPPYESPQHAPFVQLSPVPLPVLSPPFLMEPSQVSPPTALVPSNASVPPPLMLPFPLEPQSSPSSPPLAAKPPEVLIPDIPVEVPPFLHTPSPYESPKHDSVSQFSPLPLPVLSPLPSLPSPPPVNEPTLYQPPPPAGDIPLIKLSPPFVVSPSQAPSLLPGAEPPHALSLPVAANPPDASPLLPIAEPPKALTLVPPPELQPVFPSPPPASAMQSPPIPLIESSPPPTTASSPVPQLVPVNASSPAASIQPPPVFQNASSPPPLPAPSIVSSPPPQLMPPITSSPPPQLPPLINASSPLPTIIPANSPPTRALPPSSSFSPPLMVPPMNSPPDLPTLPPPGPQNASSLSPQMGPPHASNPPLQLVVPPLVSPPTSVFPTPALPPSFSFSPPLMGPPPMDSPPHLPPPFPPVPQNASSPPSHLVVPPPASPPTSAVPSIPSVSRPSIMPSPVSPSLSPPMPSHGSIMSPPLPSQAVSPLPHLVPPHPFSPPLAEPPLVFSALPPEKLHVTRPPSSSMVPGAITPRGLSPPIFSSPPLASPPSEKGSHASVSPPLMVPPHALLAPPPSTFVALPPHSSQRKATQHRVPPPLLTSPETSPPSRTSSGAAPPLKQLKPESPPPIQQPVKAPKHNTPSSRSNGSEPHSHPLPAPAPSNKPDGETAPQPLPPTHQEPEQLSPAYVSPRHAPSKPKFGKQNGTAHAPSTFQVNPPVNGTHHSWHHSAGSPIAVAPLPSPQRNHEISSAASPVPYAPPSDPEIPLLSPKISPSESSPRNTKKSLSPPLRSLPPPPPNTDCAYLTCPEPSTNTPPGSPCGCVWPMQVGMRLSVALYTFFPLVSELAQEIASGVFLKQSQVRVMGANAALQDPEKTIVLVDLVPLDDKFDNITSHLISDRFWNKQVVIDKSIFGDYDILYVRYPGLPPSPPMAPADIAVINGMPYSVGDPNASKLHPLGVDVTKQRHKHRLNAIIIAVIVFSAVLGVLMCCSLAWVLVFRHTNNNEQPTLTPRAVASLGRSSGPTGLSTGSGHSSPPLSLGSSLATYTGSAKTFSGREIEKATDNFNPSRILGEGGFGLVYSGDLDDDTRVAVKVLKRDDQQGGREFLAEVEMLSRLHHRNLVKLIGICTDERMRCLVYELIPNGSVDSHLHGTDIAPLDWASRMKIALGAARGLAYLHEDSSPRVIHRDFKSSNILLENDFTAKVSDFGLARTAMDEENRHISTRVMGTFGYVAPEYAMTGHLLVKSDVYSYGVVLLELLTGRKPVDMSQPDGQENLVAWTRPLLTSKEGLESIIDPSLGSQVPFESVAKVAAIASMCVQPEVSHRPFMGEVVQALKLVCNECDDSKDGDSRNHSRENLSIDFDAKVSSPVSGTQEPLQGQFSLPNYEPRHDVEKGMSVSEIFTASASLGRQASDSFRRHSASGPLRTARGPQFWQRIRGRSRGSVSEHGIMYKLWAGSH